MRSNTIYIALPAADSFFENKELISLFVSGNPEYLFQFTFKDQIFWGKKIETPINLDDLALAGENLLSLVSKVCPSHNLTVANIKVFPDPELIPLTSVECPA